jgi:predicted O-methyltransferase YrrM
MISFEDLYKIVEQSSHETAFNRGEAEALYNLLVSLPDGVNVVEIGVQFGRSLSVIASVSKYKNLRFTAIDNWAEVESEKARAHVYSQIAKYEWILDLENATSAHAAKSYAVPIHLLHIDGDHSYKGVLLDCQLWLPKVATGGYAVFDDFEHAGLDDVTRAIKDYMGMNEYYEMTRPFKFIGKYGNKLAVFQKK